MIKISRASVGDEEAAAVKDALSFGYFGHAAKVIEFEQRLGALLGVSHVVATNTGTSALHLALSALGIGPGDEVIVPTLTFVGCFQSIRATGARPVPCEVLPDTLSIDVADVRRRTTPATKAIMPVHYAGNPCDLTALREFASSRGLRIIEDAAHAFGSIFEGRPIGNGGDIVCFSFDSIKNITCGEGGAVICPDEGLADTMRRQRLLGMERKSHASTSWKDRAWKFEVTSPGYRYHMSNLNAAIGLAQLDKLDGFITRRREICRRYDTEFAQLSGVKPLAIDYTKAAPHIYVVRVPGGRRDGLITFLKNRDIETGIHYMLNHLHPLFDDGTRLPVTEGLFDEILTLPLHCELSDDDVAKVIESVAAFDRVAVPA